MTTKTKRKPKTLPPKPAANWDAPKAAKKPKLAKDYKPVVGDSVEFKFSEGSPRPEGDAVVLEIEPLTKGTWMAKLDVTSVVCGDPDSIRNPEKELWAMAGELFKAGTREKLTRVLEIEAKYSTEQGATEAERQEAQDTISELRSGGHAEQTNTGPASESEAASPFVAGIIRDIGIQPEASSANATGAALADTDHHAAGADEDMAKQATKTKTTKAAKKTAGKAASNGKATNGKPDGIPGVRVDDESATYVAGLVIKEHGLKAGVTDEMIKECGKRLKRQNAHQDSFNLRNAWHGIRAYVGGIK